MDLSDLSVDLDISKMIKGIKDAFFKTVRIILLKIYNLPLGVKITLAIILILIVSGIGFLTWKYRKEWQHVKY